MRLRSFLIFLPAQLALGFKQEAVTLVGVLTVLLETVVFSLVPLDLGSSDVKLAARVLVSHGRMMECFIQFPYLLIQLIQFVCLGI